MRGVPENIRCTMNPKFPLRLGVRVYGVGCKFWELLLHKKSLATSPISRRNEKLNFQITITATIRTPKLAKGMGYCRTKYS